MAGQVDLLGKATDHAAIRPLADEHRIPVPSDTVASWGTISDGRPVANFDGHERRSSSGSRR